MVVSQSPLRSFLRAAVIILLCVWYLTQRGRVLCDTTLSYCAYPFYALSLRIHQLRTNWQVRRQSREELAAALDAAQRTNEELRAELVMLRAGAVYADSLAPLRTFYERYQSQGAIIAQVLTRNCSTKEHIMVIDAGAKQGVQHDMIVLAAQGVVGRVVEVFPWYSRVMVLTDRRCKIPVVCAQTKTDAIYEGFNQIGEGHLSYVSCLQQLIPGDLVLTSGKGLIYPAGFAVGTISEVTQDAQGLYYTATVVPYSDPATLSHCILISKSALTQ